MNATPTAAKAAPSAEDIIELAERLCTVLSAENDALAQRRMARVQALQDDKENLSRRYVQAMAAVAEQPDLLRRTAPPQRERLTALAARMDELMTGNARLLQAAMESSQRLVDAVINAVKRHQQGSGGATYGRHGRLNTGAGAAARPALSINGTF